MSDCESDSTPKNRYITMQRRHFLKTAATGAAAPFLLSSSFAQVKKPATAKIAELRARIKPITLEERKQRIERARELMMQENIDALLLEGGITMNYFTGISWGRSERLFAMILPRNGEPVYVAPKFEEGRAQEQVGTARLLTWEEDESPYASIKQVLSDSGLLTGTIGIEESTRFFVSNEFNKSISSVKIVNGMPVTAGCRCVKSGHEIDLMQIANDITAEVFKSAIRTLQEGMTEKQLASTISNMFSLFGVNGGALVLFGEASAYPHGLVKEHTRQENQIVLIDGGCTVEGYASDITRTTVFGTPSDKMNKVWEIVLNAQSAALKAA